MRSFLKEVLGFVGWVITKILDIVFEVVLIFLVVLGIVLGLSGAVIGPAVIIQNMQNGEPFDWGLLFVLVVWVPFGLACSAQSKPPTGSSTSTTTSTMMSGQRLSPRLCATCCGRQETASDTTSPTNRGRKVDCHALA